MKKSNFKQSNMLCFYAYTGEGKITLWIDVKPDHDITIENIIFQKAVI